jgi:hypothetical protein
LNSRYTLFFKKRGQEMVFWYYYKYTPSNQLREKPTTTTRITHANHFVTTIPAKITTTSPLPKRGFLLNIPKYHFLPRFLKLFLETNCQNTNCHQWWQVDIEISLYAFFSKKRTGNGILVLLQVHPFESIKGKANNYHTHNTPT